MIDSTSGDTATDVHALEREILALSEAGDALDRSRARAAVAALLRLLEDGTVRSARPTEEGWEAVHWVKRGILLAFRVGETRPFEPWAPGPNPACDGSGFDFAVLLALVGSCAQVGERVHLSAGAQLGGVLEPIGLRPVVIEDDVMVGANCGVFEGTLVQRRAVLAAGVQLTGSTMVVDLVHERTFRGSPGDPLTIPEGAVVVPGSRPAGGSFAAEHGIHLHTPVIVKYRDSRTDAATALEDALR